MRFSTIAFLMLTLILQACASKAPAKFQAYAGPEITHVIVQKEQRRMYLMRDSEILRAYDIDLGFNPKGTKKQQGDGRTPEGWYMIDRRNENSRYWLSLGIDYPRNRDRAAASAAGVDPGGEIFIHGGPRYDGEYDKEDWTAGCISVTDEEMSEIFAMVPVGTWIKINP